MSNIISLLIGAGVLVIVVLVAMALTVAKARKRAPLARRDAPSSPHRSSPDGP